MRFPRLIPGALSALVLTINTLAESVVPGTDAMVSPHAGSPRGLFLQKLLGSSGYGSLRTNWTSSRQMKTKVGIIGGGTAGLYAAIILDSLDIDYEILEASDRIGGRVYTHRFDEEKWKASKPGQPDYYDYYDAGAMRFPGSTWMDRIIGNANHSLISYINSRLQPTERRVRLVPYLYEANNTFRLFNDELIQNQVIASAQAFGIPVSGEETSSNDIFSSLSPNSILIDMLRRPLQMLSADFDAGYQTLLQYDTISVRQYLASEGFSAEQINWLETSIASTEHFHVMSLTQLIMEMWIFMQTPLDSWRCVEGGMDRITDGMAKIIKSTVEVGKRATAIRRGPDGVLKVIVNSAEERVYDHVINTAPLGAMRTMDMAELDLDYRKKLAIRKLQYDVAGKIGMKFKTRWWEDLDSGSVQGGQSFTDLPIRLCVYPSYGLDTPGAAGTMIASYTWNQDSARLASYFNRDEGRKTIIEMTLRNLAKMHNVTHEFLQSQYVDSHLWNWYDDENAVGAFALFGPDDYTTVMPALVRPAANGRLHFAGEALSSGHAWMIGAINSAYRTVAEILAAEQMDEKLVQMVNTWGTVNEVDISWYTHSLKGE